MIKYLYPPNLVNGDKAVIISPSGNINPDYIEKAEQILHGWGLTVKKSKFATNQCGRFGGTIEQRLQDLQAAMDDKDVKLIFCSRGGYGVVQLLDKLKFGTIKKSPKWLVGYSDITALHSVFLRNGIISLHAPMAKHLSEDYPDKAGFLMKCALFSELTKYEVIPDNANCFGSAEGRLFGGNLSVLCGLIGTPYLKIPENGILFIEDIAESPYKIDRMMWQLKLSGILKKLSGLLVGQFTDCEEDPLMGATIKESIKNMVSGYGYPVGFNFPVGHVADNYPLVHGGVIHLKVENDIITVENKS